MSTNGQQVVWNPTGVNFTLTALPAPTPLSPSGTVAVTPGYDFPTFSWSSVTDAGSYLFYLYDATAQLSVNSGTGIISVNGTSWTPTAPLTPGHSYTWYVASVSSNGQDSVWNATGVNVTLTALPAPTPLGPKGTIAVTTRYDFPAFSWSSVTDAGSYLFYLFDDTTQLSVNGGTGIISVNGTSWSPTAALTPGHSYTWYAASVSSNGQETVWNATGANFTLAALPAPTPSNPTGTSAASSGYDLPTFTWSSVTGAHSYALYLYDNTAGLTLNGGVVNVSGISWTETTALTPGHSYSWYAGAVSTNQQVTDWNGPANFTLASLPAPTPTSPTGTSAASSGYDLPTFTWSSVTGAHSYSFYLYDNTSGQVLNGGVVNVNGTSWTETSALTPGHNYFWYAGAVSTNQQVTDWSGVATFTLASLSAPTPSSPTGTGAASSGYDLPTFTWSSVTGAHSYSFYLYDNTSGQVLNGGIVNVNGTSWTETSALTPGHNYFWYAGAVSTNQLVTDWSGAATFTLAALAAPTPAHPLSGTVTVSTPTFSWSGVSGANRYAIYLVDNSTGVVLVNSANIAGTSFVLSTPLTLNQNYTWYVGAVSTNGQDVAYNVNTSQTFTFV